MESVRYNIYTHFITCCVNLSIYTFIFNVYIYRDKLYVLNSVDLTETTSLTWEPETARRELCQSEVTDSPEYNCRNHIRVHQSIPTVGDGLSLLVCGTQATVSPQCRVVRVQSDGGTLQSFTTVNASSGILSYYPDFSEFGEFRRGF